MPEEPLDETTAEKLGELFDDISDDAVAAEIESDSSNPSKKKLRERAQSILSAMTEVQQLLK